MDVVLPSTSSQSQGRARNIPISIDAPYVGSYLVIQDEKGTFTHTGNGPDKAAYDIAMSVGTEIVAVDPGEIISVLESVSGNGNFLGNLVTIKHYADDGVVFYATYLHLMQNGVVPSVGDTVTGGQLIGFSGNTGFSTEPHLHFQFSTGLGALTGPQGLPVLIANATDIFDNLINFNGVQPNTGSVLVGVEQTDFADTIATVASNDLKTDSWSTKNSVGFGADKDDYIKHVFSSGGTLTIDLTGLFGNLDLRLLDANGNELSSSVNLGNL